MMTVEENLRPATVIIAQPSAENAGAYTSRFGKRGDAALTTLILLYKRNLHLRW